ncbi:MAG TPA: hypothetical protein PKN33_02270 [Phycisphaerae bacterium]|nr:hypothetical protein [Phycisphaerae bacterium]
MNRELSKNVYLAIALLVSANIVLSLSCVPGSDSSCTSNADCDDGDACNGAETCGDGVCVAGTPMDCDDGDSCTSDSCSNGVCENVDDQCPAVIYWGETIGEDCDAKQIRKMSVNGGDATNVLTLVSEDAVQGLAVDVEGGQMYWTMSGSSANCGDRIQRADLDGNGLESLIVFGEQPTCDSRPSPLDLALDLPNGQFFWIANGGCSPCGGAVCTECSVIRRANLDGTPMTDVLELTGTVNPSDIALDLEGGKMYWTDRQYMPSIFRADLDGSNMEPLIDSPDGAEEIALDLVNGKMYWIENGGSIPCTTGCSRIRRANLDGSGDQDIVVFENQPDFDASDFYRGLAVDPSAGKIYWGVGGFCPIEANTGRIQRADLNGDNVENVVTGLGIVYKVVVVNPSM